MVQAFSAASTEPLPAPPEPDAIYQALLRLHQPGQAAGAVTDDPIAQPACLRRAGRWRTPGVRPGEPGGNRSGRLHGGHPQRAPRHPEPAPVDGERNRQRIIAAAQHEFAQRGLDPGGLKRVGRLADGWLGSLLTPAEAQIAIAAIIEAAACAGRHVDDDHYGLSLPVVLDGTGIPEPLRASIGRRRPHTDPELLVAAGWDGARRMIEQYVEAGLSKFVVRPATRPEPFGSFLDGFVRELMPLQS